VPGLRFVPTKEENGKFISCIASHETFKNETTRTISLPLDVLYPPKIQVELDESDSAIVEGGRLVFRCHVDARPLDDVKIKWTWEGDERRLSTMDQQVGLNCHVLDRFSPIVSAS
jgi:hypothetical protein